jgi:ABC-type branched-subunit amino acid transport system substrate-binding protein
MVNSQGGIYGRQIDLQLLDSKTDTGATREAVLAACKKAFAIVGSMSAFDSGGAAAVDDCKIPDMTAITVSLARIQAKYAYPTYPNRPDYFVMGSGKYIADKYPSAIKHAAQLYLNASTTKVNAESKRTAYSQLGYVFDPKKGGYIAQTGVVEANYTSYVRAMKDRGIEYVTMTSDYQSIGRLLDAMRQQKWKPQVLEWDSVVYSPRFLDQVQGAADGSHVYLNTALFEEASRNPEMQLYEQWLSRVAPGVQPDYFGLYAWSTGRLFVELAQKAGPKLTRAGLISLLQATHAWGGNGLHGAHDIGGKFSSPCTMFVKVVSNKFVRETPSSGFNCGTPLRKIS